MNVFIHERHGYEYGLGFFSFIGTQTFGCIAFKITPRPPEASTARFTAYKHTFPHGTSKTPCRAVQALLYVYAASSALHRKRGSVPLASVFVFHLLRRELGLMTDSALEGEALTPVQFVHSDPVVLISTARVAGTTPPRRVWKPAYLDHASPHKARDEPVEAPRDPETEKDEHDPPDHGFHVHLSSVSPLSRRRVLRLRSSRSEPSLPTLPRRRQGRFRVGFRPPHISCTEASGNPLPSFRVLPLFLPSMRHTAGFGPARVTPPTNNLLAAHVVSCPAHHGYP